MSSAGNSRPGKDDFVDPRYVAARRVLLDALEALAPHRAALVVVGAQAVYLRTRLSDVGIAPYTTDSDFALDPMQLPAKPELEAAMRSAGFELLEPQSGQPEPGIWIATAIVEGEKLLVPVDLIVPEGAAAPGGRRGARLGPHGNRAARKAVGLEAALVDHDTMAIGALETGDTRLYDVKVAGAAALFVAKAHKIHDRLTSSRPGRANDKDAADVYRLMQATSPTEVAVRLKELRKDAVAGPVTEAGISHLADLFRSRAGDGVLMAIRALQLAVAEAQIVALSTGYMDRLFDTLEN